MLRTIETRVIDILENFEDTRDDDYILYAKYIEMYNTNLSSVPLSEAFTNHVLLDLPCFETISRVRRKIQEFYPDLKPSLKIRIIRHKKRKEMRDYALNKTK